MGYSVFTWDVASTGSQEIPQQSVWTDELEYGDMGQMVRLPGDRRGRKRPLSETCQTAINKSHLYYIYTYLEAFEVCPARLQNP